MKPSVTTHLFEKPFYNANTRSWAMHRKAYFSASSWFVMVMRMRGWRYLG